MFPTGAPSCTSCSRTRTCFSARARSTPVERVAAGRQRDLGIVARVSDDACASGYRGRDGGVLGPEAGAMPLSSSAMARDDQQRQPGAVRTRIVPRGRTSLLPSSTRRIHEQWTVRQHYPIPSRNGGFDGVAHLWQIADMVLAVPRSPATLCSGIASATMSSPTDSCQTTANSRKSSRSEKSP